MWQRLAVVVEMLDLLRKKSVCMLSIVLCAGGALYALPDMSGLAGPGLLPAGADPFVPPVDQSTPAANAPVFGEWIRQAGPDQNVVATGDRFTSFTGADAGKDTRFLVFGQTAAGSALRDARILRLDGDKKVCITLDSTLPQGSMYLIWPRNSAGWGRPITVNNTLATWIGPDRAAPGQVVAVYGQNMSRDTGNSVSNVYINGYGFAAVVSANPYKVDFVVPAGLANGTYDVWVHNGRGDKYGWSGPLSLTVESGFSWNGTVYNVKNAPFNATGNGITDDGAAIQAALRAANTPGSRVYLPAGTYAIGSYIEIPDGVWLYGDGMNSTKILRTATATGGPDKCTIFFGSRKNIKISDMTIDGGTLGGWYDRLIWQRSAVNIWYVNCRIIARNFASIDNAHSSYQFWDRCEFRQNSNFLSGRQFFIKNCTFYGTYAADAGLTYWGVREASVEQCAFRNEDHTRVEGVLVRMLVANAAWGECRLCYFGDNTVDKIGQIQAPGVDDNKGEQYCWEGGGAKYIGSPAAATPTSITFNDPSAPDPGQSIMILNGRGIGQARQINGFTRPGGSLTITVSPPFNIVPDTSSKIGYGAWWNNIVIYRNYQSGRDDIFRRYTAQCAVQFYGGSYATIVDNNTFNHLRAGVQFWSLVDQGWGTIGSSYFGLVKNNRYVNVEYGMLDRCIGGDGPFNSTVVPMFGIVLRNNSIVDEIGGVTDQAINGVNMWGETTPQADMSLFEHNTIRNIPRVAGRCVAPATNQMFYKNIATLGTAPSAGSTGIRFPQGANPLLRANTFDGYADKYSGTLPGAIMEAPYRLVEIDAPSNDSITDTTHVWNAGTSALNWNVTADASWLSVSPIGGTIPDERSASLLVLTVRGPELISGDNTATLTLTSGNATMKIGVIARKVAETATAPFITAKRPGVTDELRIYGADGRLVDVRKLSGGNEPFYRLAAFAGLLAQRLPAGVYLCKLHGSSSGNLISRRSVVITH